MFTWILTHGLLQRPSASLGFLCVFDVDGTLNSSSRPGERLDGTESSVAASQTSAESTGVFIKGSPDLSLQAYWKNERGSRAYTSGGMCNITCVERRDGEYLHSGPVVHLCGVSASKEQMCSVNTDHSHSGQTELRF